MAEEMVKDKLGKLTDAVNNLATQVNNQTTVLGKVTSGINRLITQQQAVEEAISRMETSPSPETAQGSAGTAPSR